jgi:hypothetical protein
MPVSKYTHTRYQIIHSYLASKEIHYYCFKDRGGRFREKGRDAIDLLTHFIV